MKTLKQTRKTNSVTNLVKVNPNPLPANNNKTKSSASTYQKKKTQVIEKIALLMKNKFNKLFLDKGYNHSNLISDLNSIVTDKDLENFHYNTLIIRIEKTILEIVSKLESKEVKGFLDVNKINSLINNSEVVKNLKTVNSVHNLEPHHKESFSKILNKKEISSKNLISSRVDNVASGRNEKMEESLKKEKVASLQEKAKDEWALIAKLNYAKYLEGEKERKSKEEEIKKLQKEILEKQIKEKEILKMREKDEINHFHKQQVENLKKIDLEMKQKDLEIKEKVKREKEMHESMISQTKKHKEEILKKEKIEDKKFLDRIKSDLEMEEEKISNKKKEERDVYLKLIKENEEKIELKKKEKEKEKENKQKAIEEYSKHIEKLEEERKMDFINRLNKMKKQSENLDINLKKKDELIKKYEQSKLMREQEERELK